MNPRRERVARRVVGAGHCRSACASTRSWTAGDVRTANHALDPGDHVVVVLKSGERVETVLKAIDKTQVQPEAGDYPWADIKQLEAEKTNAVGPVLLVVVLAGIYVLGTIAFDVDGCEFFGADCDDDD